MGNAGFISSAVCLGLEGLESHPPSLPIPPLRVPFKGVYEDYYKGYHGGLCIALRAQRTQSITRYVGFRIAVMSVNVWERI